MVKVFWGEGNVTLFFDVILLNQKIVKIIINCILTYHIAISFKIICHLAS